FVIASPSRRRSGCAPTRGAARLLAEASTTRTGPLALRSFIPLADHRTHPVNSRKTVATVDRRESRHRRFQRFRALHRHDDDGTSLAPYSCVTDEPDVTFAGRLVREGGMSILCRIDGRDVWVPRVQLLPGT